MRALFHGSEKLLSRKAYYCTKFYGMKNSFILISFVLLFFGCIKEESLKPNLNASPINPNNGNTGNPGNTGSVPSSIYYFQTNNLRSLDLDNKGNGTFTKISNDDLTQEIYSIAYDPSDGTFFGWTDYQFFNYSGEYYESYNPQTKEIIKVKIAENVEYHSVAVNTKLRKKILIKYDSTSFQKVTFQEVSSQGIIIFESPVVELEEQVSKFIYVSSLDAFIAKSDRGGILSIAIVDANTYSINTVTINVNNSATPIGTAFRDTDLNYDKQNKIIYCLRPNGLYKINVNTQTAQLIETDWIEFFQSLYSFEEPDGIETIYYQPTNEIVIHGNGFFGSSSGSSKFFAIDLATKKTREINTERNNLTRVYGVAVAN